MDKARTAQQASSLTIILKRTPDVSKITDRMIETLIVPKPKRCICCGAPAGKVRHD